MKLLLERALFTAMTTAIRMAIKSASPKIDIKSCRLISVMAVCQTGISVVVGGSLRTSKALAYGILAYLSTTLLLKACEF